MMTTTQHSREFQAPAGFLSMRNVDIARGQKVVLQDVNLTIATRRTHRHPGAERVRKIDPDQSHDLRVLSHRS